MTTVTKQHAEYYKLPPQREDESAYDFRHRIAGDLRDMGKLIEAHEAQQDARFNDADRGGDVIQGIMGAMAQTLQGVDYRASGSMQVGCDIAAGGIMKYGKPSMSGGEAMLMMAMMDAGRR